jgi:exopolysaccharide biosynthesis protein
VADATGAIAESNENDNTWERNFYWEGGGGVTVTSVWTTDGSGNNKTTFNCGDSIRYYGNIYNNTGSSKTAYFSWTVTGPCGSIASWSGNLTTGTGNQWWWLPTSIPSNACAGTYTYKLSVTYGGSTTSKSITFTVNCSGGSVPGIDYHTRSGVYVFKIDMRSSNLSFEMVMAKDCTSVNYGKPSYSPREYVRNMVARSPYASRNPVLAFNADYFGNLNNDTVFEHGPEGLTVKNGARFDGYKGVWSGGIDTDGNEWKRSSLSISNSKTIRIGKQTDCTSNCVYWNPDPSAYYNTAGGGPLFIENGQRIGGAGSTQPCRNESAGGIPDWYCTNSFNWTAAGVTQDGRYLIVAVGTSQTMDTMATVLLAEGAWRAMKFDGGASTQVWYKGSNIISGGRQVANAILVFSSQ